MVHYASGRERVTWAQEDCLKALYHLGASDRTVTTSELAQRLGVSAPSVSEMVLRLSSLGLVTRDRRRGQRLTRDGERVAVELVRHHRLLERFLVEVLGYGWDEVHEEAERLEHVLSERMEARIFELLGRPELDPHGDAIPSVEGAMQPTSDVTLARSVTGDHLIVSRVSDEDPDKLRALRDLGLLPGAELRILAGSRYEGPIDLLLGERSVSVPLGLARVTYVETLEAGDR